MKKAIMLLGMIGALSAHADGFVCDSVSKDLRVKVYNHTQPQLGTRTAAIMVVSDPRVNDGHKTIATFDSAQGLLTNSSTSYTSNVDLRFATSNRKGELIGGTKLGELDLIHLDVDFNYSEPLAAGQTTKGLITLYKRNGQQIQLDAECDRYLKN